ncbi:hypothetical protein [Nocardia vaccinii]|uniref:hypothetical protein n=1 Tax=Nocardia vaccinii TaxID=1822 RepID=UPI0012F4C3FA|nr:hypothetical protein [Nocardia vaccinii]
MGFVVEEFLPQGALPLSELFLVSVQHRPFGTCGCVGIRTGGADTGQQAVHAFWKVVTITTAVTAVHRPIHLTPMAFDQQAALLLSTADCSACRTDLIGHVAQRVVQVWTGPAAEQFDHVVRHPL